MRKHRIQLVSGILVIFAICMLYMNLRYDPLARNTSVNASNRSMILRYLDSDDIRYIVENNIDVNTFLEFVDQPLFVMQNYRLYRAAMDTRKASPKEIVTFINAVAGKIEVSKLMTLIPNYDYATLRKLIVDQNPYSYQAQIVENPYDLDTYLDMNHTIGEFTPSDLVFLSDYPSIVTENETIRLRKDVAEQLSAFCEFLTESVGEPCGGFIVSHGFLSYHEIQDSYLKSVQEEGAQAAFDQWGMPSHNEHQLGLAIDFKVDEQQVLDWIMTKSYQTMSANAMSFGFLFYPNDAVSFVHNSKPYHLRYVGVDKAHTCQEDGVCFYQPYQRH